MSRIPWSATCRLILAILLGTAGGTAWAETTGARITWGEEYYNPRPSDGDLVIPMPCGGAMVFRPVVIESTGLLADEKIQVGLTDESLGYAEDRRFEYIAGTFTDTADPYRRIYYIGKYVFS
jgi:hypothetical protein